MRSTTFLRPPHDKRQAGCQPAAQPIDDRRYCAVARTGSPLYRRLATGQMPEHRRRSAYSLIEVVVAGAILMIAIAAAGAMALTVVAQQETNSRIAQALNYQEQAARLYQLGLTPGGIAAILPPEPAVVSLTFANGATVTHAGIGDLEHVDCVLVHKPNPATAGWTAGTWNPGSATATRTDTMVVVRPTIR